MSLNTSASIELAVPEIEEKRVPAPAEPRLGSLYRVVWRWHFYAGLIAAPFFFLAAATGEIYVFHNELSTWLYRDLQIVTPQQTQLNYDEQFARLKAQVPEVTELDGIRVWNDPTRSTHFIVHALPGGHSAANQMHRIYFVNPYDGTVLGSQIIEHEFQHIVLDLHRTLCGGTIGRLLVELATSWGIVLIITGVYLWWPRNGNWGAGILWPRLSGAPYVILRDLHSTAGFYTAPIALLILFTGLFVSVVWGTGFTMVSKKMEQSLFEFFAHADSPPESDSAAVTYDTAIKTALNYSQPGDDVYFQLAEKPEHAHRIYVMYKGDTNTVRGLDIDQYTGKLLASTSTEQLEPMVRLLAIAVSLHQGKTFGMTSKVLAFVTCLVMMGLSITGVWMWWIRRPTGRTGFPPRVAARVPMWVWGLVVLVGIVLPVVGASILLILAAEAVIRVVRGARTASR